MPDRLVFDGTAIWTVATTPNAVLKYERDLTGRTHVIDELGDLRSNLYRGTKRQTRSYVATLDLLAGAGKTLRQVMAEWEELHSPDGGLRTIERETSSGIFYLDAVPSAPRWGDDRGPVQIEVTQEYVAPTPMWYGAEVNSAANFNGVNPVNLACVNAGDTSTWLRFLIAEAVEDPKITGPGWVVEFGLTMAAGDTLAIDCKTPASAWYTPLGGAAARAYGYRTVATSFRKALLPVAVGATNLVLTAAAGVATCTAYWRPRFEALG